MRSTRSFRFHLSLGVIAVVPVFSSTLVLPDSIEALPSVFHPILPRVPAIKYGHNRRINGLLTYRGRKRAASGCASGQDSCDDQGTECCAIGTHCYQSGCCTNQQIGCAGQGCCPTGLQCCAFGDCCPMTYSCTAGGGCCPPGASCFQPNNPPSVPGPAQPLRPQVAGQVATPTTSSTQDTAQSKSKKAKSTQAPSSSSAPDDPATLTSRSRSSSIFASLSASVTVLPNGQTSVAYVTVATGTNTVAAPTSSTTAEPAAAPPIGPIIGTLVGIIIVILLVYWFVRRRLRNTEYDDNQPFWDVDDNSPGHAAPQMTHAEHGSQLSSIRRGDPDDFHFPMTPASQHSFPISHQTVTDTPRYHQSELTSNPTSPVASYPPSAPSDSQSDHSRRRF